MTTTSAHQELDAAIREVDKLRASLKRGKSKQIGSIAEREIVKATALSWFNGHLDHIRNTTGEESCKATCKLFHDLIAHTDRSTLRTKYDVILKQLKKELSNLRKFVIDGGTVPAPNVSSDESPDFSSLIGDPKMQEILGNRWQECVNCIGAGAPLAATVMMGGFLETLLLARFNREVDKSPIFRASTAPHDKRTRKTLQLNEWTLRNYLDVGHELGWVRRSTKDVGEVVRDYRNYIHPYKQASHGLKLDAEDARLFWEITKEITRQLIA